MKGEIDRDFYCSGVDIRPMDSYYCKEKLCARCENKHRKWPTPEQYKEEYGGEYPEYGAVYALMTYGSSDFEDWIAGVYKDFIEDGEPLVCACTPWGKPPADWRPE